MDTPGSPVMKACSTIVWTVVVALFAWSVSGAEPAVSKPATPKVPAAAQEDAAEASDEAAEEVPVEEEEPPVVEKEAITVRSRDKETFKIEEALAYPRFEFQMEDRRDPFARPDRADAALAGPRDVTDEGPRVITLSDELSPEQQKELVDKAAVLLTEIKQHIDDQDYREAVRVYDRDLAPLIKRKEDVTVPNLKSRLDDEMVGMQTVLLSRWKAADYEVVLKQANEIQKAFSDARDILLIVSDSDKKRKIARIKTEADSYGHRAKVRLEFAKKVLVISGIAWSPGRSFAIVNGRDMRVGAMIDEAKITDITTSKITMEFKGETFDKYVE